MRKQSCAAWCPQDWIALGTCMWESLEVTPPSLPLHFHWAGEISCNPCLGYHAVIYCPEPPKGAVPGHSRLGLQHILCCKKLSRGRPLHPLALTHPSFLLQLSKMCLPTPHMLLVNAKCYLPQQSETSPSFPQTISIKNLKVYLELNSLHVLTTL